MISTDWKARHELAMRSPLGSERPIVQMIDGLKSYALAHQTRFGWNLERDYVLGPAWLQMVKGLRELLNGDLGRLDGGTVDAAIVDMAHKAGFTDEELDA